MSIDKTLGLRLDLVTNFANASRDASAQIGAIADGMERLKNLGGRFTMAGLDELSQGIQTLNSRVSTSTQRVNEMGNAVDNTARKTRTSKQTIDQTAQSINNMGRATQQAQTAILRLGTSMTKLGDAVVVVDRVGNAFHGITAEAVAAKRAVDDLEASLYRLQAAAPRMALGSGVRDSQGFTTVLPPGREPAVTPRYTGGFIPLPNNTPRYALPPAYGSRYGPIPQPAYRNYSEAIPLTGSTYYEPQAALPPGGSTGGAWAYSARPGVGTSFGGYQPPPPGGWARTFGNADWWGDVGKVGSGMYRFGNDIQSSGYAAAVNAAILGGWMIPAVKGAADIEDLQSRNREAVVSAGGSAAQTDEWNLHAMDVAAQTGSNFQQTTSAVYDFLSSSPEALMSQYGKNPAVQQALMQAYMRVAKMDVAGSASTHPVSMEDAALNTNAMITNLGYDVSTPQKYLQAVRDVTNILINMKNRTSGQIDLIGSSYRAIGPIAAQTGMSVDAVTGFIGAMYAGKYRGTIGGQGFKRLLLRQANPPKQLRAMQDYIEQISGGRDSISLFDKKGDARSIAAVGADLVDFEDRNHLKARERLGIESRLSGLYAFPQLGLFLKMIRDQKKAHPGESAVKAFEDYGRSFRTGKVDGMDAVPGSFKQRTKNNTQNAIDKTGNEILKERQKLFKQMEPDILAVLKDISGLVQWFDKLSPSTKKMAVEFLAASAGISAVAGIFNILFGNTVKLLGGMIKLGAGAVQIGKVVATGEKLEKLSPLANGAGLAIRKLGGWAADLGKGAIGIGKFIAEGAKAVILGPIMDGAAIAVRALGTSFYGIPIIGWIAALVTAGTLLYEGWTRDWGGIREKTSAVWTWIKNMLQQFPGIIIGMMGPVGLALELIFNKGFRDKVMSGIGGAINWIRGTGSMVGNALGSWATQALRAGGAFIHNLMAGIQGAVHNASGIVKWALQKIRDFFPGSEPKDGSSPLRDMARSGRALVTNFTDGITAGTPGAVQVASASAQQIRDGIDAIIAGHGVPKAKKGKKAKISPADTFIDLKPGETIAKIQHDAILIEAALERAGAVIHQKWIDLRQGMSIARVYGDPTAYHKAVSDNRHTGSDPALKAVRDYMLNVKRFPHSFEQEMKTLNTLLLQSTSAHTRAVINGMIGTLLAEHQKAMQKYAKSIASWAGGSTGHAGIFGQLTNEFNREGTLSQQFTSQADDSKLQDAISLRKNVELPTLKELIHEKDIELTQQKALNKTYAEESAMRDKITQQILDLTTKADKLNLTDEKSRQLHDALYQQAGLLWQQLQQLDAVLLQQKATVDSVDASVRQYNQDIDVAKSKNHEWAGILSDSFAKAGQDAMSKLGDAMNNGMDTLLQKVFNAKRKGIVGFIGSFFADAFGQAFAQVSGKLTSTFSNDITGSFNNLFANLFPTSKSSDKPQKVQLTDSSGTDISQDVHDGITATSQNTSNLTTVASNTSTTAVNTGTIASNTATTAAGKATGSKTDSSSDNNDPISNAINKALKSKLGKTIEGVAGAYAGYEMATAPGEGGVMQNAMGALGVYSSITSIPGFGQTPVGQGVAIAAGLYTLFSHHDDPAKMPDKYDTANYTRDIGELTGSASTAYGPAFNAALDPVMQQLGGKSELSYIEQWVAANINSSDASTKALAQQLQGQFGSSGNGQLTHGHDIGQVSVVGGSLSGSYTDVQAAAQSAVSSIQQFAQAAQQAALQQQENADRLAASFSSIIFGGPNGFFIPYGATGGGGSTGSILGNNGNSGGGSDLPIKRNPLPLPHPPRKGPFPPIHIDLSGMQINDSTSVDKLERMLNQAIPDLVQAVRQADYNDSRLYGDYASALS